MDSKSVSVPVTFIYSDSYEKAEKYVASNFPELNVRQGLVLDGISTVEMLLSNNVTDFMATEASLLVK